MSERVAEFTVAGYHIRVYRDGDKRRNEKEQERLLYAIRSLCTRFGPLGDYLQAKDAVKNT